MPSDGLTQSRVIESIEGGAPIYFCPAHWRAHDAMLEALHNSVAVTAFVGEPGVGKAVVVSRVLDNLPNACALRLTADAETSFSDIAASFVVTLGGVPSDTADLSGSLADRCRKLADTGLPVILTLEGADRLETKTLEALAALTAASRTVSRTGLSLVLVGRPSLLSRLAESAAPSLQEVAKAPLSLRGLRRSEMLAYLRATMSPKKSAELDPDAALALERAVDIAGGSVCLAMRMLDDPVLRAARVARRAPSAAEIDAALLSDAFTAFADALEAPTGPREAEEPWGEDAPSPAPGEFVVAPIASRRATPGGVDAIGGRTAPLVAAAPDGAAAARRPRRVRTVVATQRKRIPRRAVAATALIAALGVGSVAVVRYADDLSMHVLDWRDRAASTISDALPAPVDEPKAHRAPVERTPSPHPLSDARQSEAARLVAQGDAAYQAQRLTQPAGANAYDFYLAALEVDPEQPAARAGVERIARFFDRRAQVALERKEFDTFHAMSDLAAQIRAHARVLP